MKLTVIANHHGGTQMHRFGEQREANDQQAKELIGKGLVKEYETGDEKKYPVATEPKVNAGEKEKGDGFVADINIGKEKVQKNENGTNKK